jgi:hypothetical protein
MNDRFIVSTDPGHGWLLVAPEDMVAVGLTEADITPYSYRSPDGVIALEEDCDMGTFLDAWKAKNPGKEPTLVESFAERNPIRNWGDFGTKPSIW